MLYMFSLTLFLVAGISVGYCLRGRKQLNISKITVFSIVVLIFSLGFGIGSNRELLNSLPRIGWNIVVIASLTMLSSLLLVIIATRLVGLKR